MKKIRSLETKVKTSRGHVCWHMSASTCCIFNHEAAYRSRTWDCETVLSTLSNLSNRPGRDCHFCGDVSRK